MRAVGITAVIVSAVLLFSSCGKANAAKETTAPARQETTSEQTEAQTAEAVSADTLDFSDLPEELRYSSGFGHWADDMTLHDDGTFDGMLYDRDAGVSELYIRIYNGKFTKPQKLTDHSYSMRIEFLNVTNDQDKLDELGDEEYYKDYKIIPVEDPPLDRDREVIIFLPGTPLSEIPDECYQWIHFRQYEEDMETIPENMYVLCQQVEEDTYVVFDGRV